MSLEETNVVDAIGTDKTSGMVLLSIIDYWDWSNESAHIIGLQKNQ